MQRRREGSQDGDEGKAVSGVAERVVSEPGGGTATRTRRVGDGVGACGAAETVERLEVWRAITRGRRGEGAARIEAAQVRAVVHPQRLCVSLFLLGVGLGRFFVWSETARRHEHTDAAPARLVVLDGGLNATRAHKPSVKRKAAPNVPAVHDNHQLFVVLFCCC